MNKSYKAAYSVGAVALVLAGSVMAALPAQDKWSVTTGIINGGTCTDLGATFTCGTAMTDNGFYQRMVTDTATNVVYFQTIITENGATATNAALDGLKFSDESFVRTGNVNGIFDKQRISETKNTTTFTASTVLGSGWAGDNLKLTQGLKDTSDSFQTDFIFAQKGNASLSSTSAGSVYAKGMKITAYVPLQGGAAGDSQDFVLVDLSGDYAKSSVAGSAVGTSKVVLAGATPDTMQWTHDNTAGNNTGNMGENIKAIWVGQDLTNLVGQQFGFLSYENKTTPAYISNYTLAGTLKTDASWDAALWGDRTTKPAITDPFTPFP